MERGEGFPLFYYVTVRRLLRFLRTNDILFTWQTISAQEATNTKKSDFSEKKLKVSRVIIWLIGFVLYRLLMQTDLITGCTIPDMFITFALTAIMGLIENQRK